MSIDPWLNKVHCGDALKLLTQMPAESIDMSMFSPAYWGLRDYGSVTETIWGADCDCEHEWRNGSVHVDNLRFRDPNKLSQVGSNSNPAIFSNPKVKQQFCVKCGAWKGQLGLEPHPQLYIEHLVELCRLIRRVLKKTGNMYIVIGDTYCNFSSKGGIGEIRRTGKNDNVMLAQRRSTYQGEKTNWLQPKQKLLIPERVAIALQEDGWLLRSDIIWFKRNHMPCSAKDRFTCGYEHVYFFTKSRKYFFDLDEVRVPSKWAIVWSRKGGSKEPWTKNDPRKRWGITEKEFRAKTSDTSFKGPETMRQAPEPGEPHAFHELGKNPGDVWVINTEPSSDYWCPKCKKFVKMKKMRCIICETKVESHFAVYPEKLCEIPIRASCPTQVCIACGKPREKILRKTKRIQQQWAPGRAAERIELAKGKHGVSSTIATGYKFAYRVLGWSICNCNAGFKPGIVLDPMCGRGTTLIEAKKLGRNYIGIDINPNYCEMTRKKLSEVSQPLTEWIHQV